MKELNKVKCFLLDLDGTLYLDDSPIKGAVDAVARMQERGRVIFLTNNSSKGRNDYVKKLTKMGFSVTPDDVLTSGVSTIDYLKTNYLDKKVFLFGNEYLRDEFAFASVPLSEKKPEICVVGFDTTFDYDRMTVLCDFIRSGVPYIATHPDINCPTKNGYKPDVGSFLALIKASTGFSPLAICGKPFIPMGDAVERITGLEHSEIAMVGDRINTDMLFALNNNYVSVLVLTGESTRNDLELSGYNLDYCINSIADWDNYL